MSGNRALCKKTSHYLVSIQIVVNAGKKDDLQEKATMLEVGKDCHSQESLVKTYKKEK